MDRSLLVKKYEIFEEGMSYEVIQSFCDYKNVTYELGDSLLFIGSNYVPYDSGLSLFFEKDGSEIQIMLRIDSHFQEEIALNLEDYFRAL